MSRTARLIIRKMNDDELFLDLKRKERAGINNASKVSKLPIYFNLRSMLSAMNVPTLRPCDWITGRIRSGFNFNAVRPITKVATRSRATIPRDVSIPARQFAEVLFCHK